MRITKKTYNYGLKMSRNYQSVSVNEGIEVEISDENSAEEMSQFFDMKTEIQQKVRKECEEFLDSMKVPDKNLDKETGKVVEEKKSFAGVDTKTEECKTCTIPEPKEEPNKKLKVEL